MDASLAASFAAMPWWGYLLGALAGLGFGVLQVWLLRLSVLGEPPRKWLFAVKYALWAAALVVAGALSVPLLLAFAAAATATQLAGACVSYQKARKDAK